MRERRGGKRERKKVNEKTKKWSLLRAKGQIAFCKWKERERERYNDQSAPINGKMQYIGYYPMGKTCYNTLH